MVATVIAMLVLIGLCIPVLAAPAVPQNFAVSAVTPVRDGCGGGWHAAAWRDRWGNWHRKCVPNRG